MSDADRDKWQRRYRDGAYGTRTHPSALVGEHVPGILAIQQARDGGRVPEALDLACGAGRNAVYLARLGYRVDAVDIAREALERGEQAARAAGVRVSWICRDLDDGLPPGLGPYDLIVIVRYLDLSLVSEAAERLRPGGYLVCESHLETTAAVIGPRDPHFRAAPGALRAAASTLEIVHHWEGLTNDPDGRAVALARLVARRLRGTP